MNIKDRVAIVTGSGSGIGSDTAKRFAELGAIVVVNDINKESAEKVADEIKSQGGRAIAVAADISKEKEVQAMVEKVLNEFQRVDILINNAGITRDALMSKMTEQMWDEVLDVHLKGAFLCSKAVLAPMKEQGYGRIVNISSGSIRGNIGQSNYSAAKLGMLGLTRTLAMEVGKHNITVNCVAPGPIYTAMTEAVPEKFRQLAVNSTVLKRFGETTEIANALAFFASEEAGFITGQMLNVCGGQSIGVIK